ncbi:MAG: hypothetical protein P8H39_12695 [Thalassotalea sp.]|nr:hypothetical protein [Thalassotalea sp.]
MLKAVKQNQQRIIKAVLICALLTLVVIASKWGIASLTFMRAEQLHTQLIELNNYHSKLKQEEQDPDLHQDDDIFSHSSSSPRRSHEGGNPQSHKAEPKDPDLRQDDDVFSYNSSSPRRSHEGGNPQNHKAEPKDPDLRQDDDEIALHPERQGVHPERPNRHPELDLGSYKNQQQALYQQALNKITTAISLHNNPQYLEKKAQIIEWGAHHKLEPDYIKSLNQAKELYLKSTKLRPTWPGTWAALALIKWQLNEFDNELKRYLKNAHSFGKNSPEVHLVWAELAIAIKQSNNPQLINYLAPLQNIADYHIKNVRKISHQR